LALVPIPTVIKNVNQSLGFGQFHPIWNESVVSITPPEIYLR